MPVGGAIGRITRRRPPAISASPTGLILAQGGIDAHIGMVGADTLAPGELLMIGGTSVVHLFQLAGRAGTSRGFWGPYPHALVDDHWLVEAGQVSAGSVLSWFAKDMFALDDAGVAALREAAEALPVGGTGLLTLDYFMGNRTPYRDPLLRGAVLGLSLGHDRAALYRSAVEGVALASANVLKRMGELGVSCRRIVSAGGYAKNRLWLRRPSMRSACRSSSSRGESHHHRRGRLGRGRRGPRAGSLRRREGRDAAGRDDRAGLAAHRRYGDLLGEYLEATELLAPLSRRLATRQIEEGRPCRLSTLEPGHPVPRPVRRAARAADDPGGQALLRARHDDGRPRQGAGLTRWQASRLLSEARESGIVRIEIVPRAPRSPELESRLQRRFGLKDAVVVPARRTRTTGCCSSKWRRRPGA